MDIAALVDELFFASKVEAAFRRMGSTVRILTAAEAGSLAACRPDLLVLDLGLPEAVRSAAIAAMAAAQRPVIAVGSHVDTATLQWAAKAGCAEVLTRGEVDRALATLAAKHLARLP